MLRQENSDTRKMMEYRVVKCGVHSVHYIVKYRWIGQNLWYAICRSGSVHPMRFRSLSEAGKHARNYCQQLIQEAEDAGYTETVEEGEV